MGVAQSTGFDAKEVGGFQVLQVDGGLSFRRGWRDSAEGSRAGVLVVHPVSEPATRASLDRLAREYSLKDELDSAWAVRPLELLQDRGRTILLLEDPGGELLSSLVGAPMEVGRFLALAVGLAAAVGGMHQRGLIHKDIKPHNIWVTQAEELRLTGFGVASRLRRERQPPGPPEVIAGTLAYMAPEQTGRMNRSVDSRSDLYSLGVTFYEMLTGGLPFTATDPMEWVHCHIARQAEPPGERASGIPDALSSIVMKLLAKTADERYQTAAGVEADLRRCLSDWRSHGRIDAFSVGAHDASDRLLVTEELYGREREIGALLSAFDRVATNGAPELVLVSGYSGVGKSSVVNELHKALVPRRGLFASGKFEQYKRDVPYATLAQAFQTLIRQILVRSEAEVAPWRRLLREALGANGQLMVNLVPELEFIIGKQPAAPDLPTQEAQNRFQLMFRRFLGVFATQEHPLALFLDDLQWLDAATLDLIEHLLTRAEVGSLLLVGAYRDNEVDPSHPLLRTLEAIKQVDARVTELVLAPLAVDDVGQIAASALQCNLERARPLTQLLYEKTGGNPFFSIQFLTELAEEGLLVFDPVAQAWHWEIDRIHAKGYSDNVVDLMVEKLKRLSPRAQQAMKQLACLGHSADIKTLALVSEETEKATRAMLREGLSMGLVDRQDGAYRFSHDRIQQAAYSLIPEGRRVDIHLRIGRALLASLSAGQLEERLFDVVGQLNRGAGQLIERREKAQVAKLNLRAGGKAKASAAYASACAYLTAGLALLDESDWDSQYELMFNLGYERAECELLNGNFEEAQSLIVDLLTRAAPKVDQANTYRLKVVLHTLKSENAEAVETALSCLRLFGIDIPAHPTEAEVHTEYETVRRSLDGRPIESLIDLPMMTDPEMLTAMQVLSVALSPAYNTDFHLWGLLALRMGKVSIEHGTSGASAHFGDLGLVLGAVFHRYSEGYRFAELARSLVEKHGFVAYRAKAYHVMGIVAIWAHPVARSIHFLQTAFRTATDTGDLAVACYCMEKSVAGFLMRSDPLDTVWRESEISLNFVRKARYHDVADVIVSQQRFIACMQGRTSAFSSFSDAEFDEASFEARLTRDASATTVALYWILKLQARFLSGDYPEALVSADKAKALLWAAPVHFDRLLDYFYYAALTLAALYDNASAGDKEAWRGLLTKHQEQLAEWAESYRPTFADKLALVSAEIARIEGRELDAERLYEQALRAARDHGFIQKEAIVCEVAARFHRARGFEIFADAYLRKARDCYLRWGADGKVRQLDQLYPQLAAPEGQGSAATVSSSVQQLDVASVVKASQALSSEIILPKLIEQLMTIAIENAGADRGLLMLPSGDEYLIQAEARATGDQIQVTMRQDPITPNTCPESIVRYVIRTRESVILDDASRPNLFSADEYLRGQRSKSILCLPLIKQQQLSGILLLENALTSHAFTPARIAVLELLAAQAAISLENTRLYSDLGEREAKVRRLVDANIIGILIIDLAGRIIEANDAFLRMLGYEREDLVSGRMRWTELTPPEWRAADAKRLDQVRSTPTLQPFEKEYFHRNGGRVPVLVGVARIEGTSNQAVTFVIDLTDRKRAEAELAHAGRVATMGQLTASIGHEVNQPIAALLTNAETAARWLDRQPPNLEKARALIDRIISDGKRTADIVNRIRDFSKKGATQQAALDINQAILEITTLTRSVISEHRVVASMRLSEGLPQIFGDKIQLQQVVLNLIMNAIEAMSEVGAGARAMLISTREVDQVSVMVEVSDSGPGLTAASLARLFEPFYTTKSSGLGMGLSICRTIVDAHGGRLWATPNEPRGAVFRMSLPIGGLPRDQRNA